MRHKRKNILDKYATQKAKELVCFEILAQGNWLLFEFCHKRKIKEKKYIYLARGISLFNLFP